MVVLSEFMDTAAAKFRGAGRAIDGAGIAVAEAFFPETVQVAIRVDFAAVAGFKIGLRCFSGFQVMEMDSRFIDESDPFDIVLFFHGMSDRTDRYIQVAIDFLESRYVFFMSCIDRASREMSQLLAIIYDFFRSLSSA